MPNRPDRSLAPGLLALMLSMGISDTRREYPTIGDLPHERRDLETRLQIQSAAEAKRERRRLKALKGRSDAE